ncbi:MBL fold metallo-hydrolase [Knoellia subterranea]|uniref:Zn-dependent hydrolase n=1 Tax=Knoellia subterranea KCTC 19937 TaxID=1385521 RepID=A0A0A0JTM6_9MICO|nr:MBL fold metallo-hydrolase [Knoellia subterranea]KGN38991.1 Zn-dependent hydrolase [Knoellia subterranea KCTC 19937]
MRVTHLGHSCLLVEIGGERILIDPGTFTPGFEDLRDLSAVVVTHQHPDHLDPGRVPALVRANAGVRVLCDPGSAEVLAGVGVEASTHNGATTLGAVTITPVGEVHALIHEDLPRIPNVGVVLRAEGEPNLFHPGDAVDQDPGAVDVVAFPLNAPWQRSRELTGFLRRLNPRTAVPIHDGLLNERGRALYLRQAAELGGTDTEIRDLAGRGATDLSGH